MPGVRVRVPGKVNLELRVGPLRADGFHTLATVFQAVSLYDDVTELPLPDGEVTLTVSGDQAPLVPLDETNLAVRAARALAAWTGVEAGAALQLHKGIPVAGGMAGGSADAAAALVACDALWHTGCTRDQLAELAADLGSDVPFPLFGGTAIGSGRGERLTSTMARGTFHWVIALAADGLSTPGVFAELDRQRVAGGQAADAVEDPQLDDALLQALRAGDARALAARLGNDLQEPACSLRPALRRTLEVGCAEGALAGIVSGSGPSVAFLVEGPRAALEVAVALTASGVAGDVRRVHGPVPGARVVEAVRA
jgi:4-diphosphocytidyl-2-C-methyl-D-erythritol kinase